MNFVVLILAFDLLFFLQNSQAKIESFQQESDVPDESPLSLEGFILLWKQFIDNSFDYLAEYEYFLLHNETILELSKSLSNKAHSFKNSTFTDKLKSYAESSFGSFLIKKSADGSLSEISSRKDSEMTIRMGLKLLWDQLKIPTETFKIHQYKEKLEHELLEKFLENYNDFKYKLIKDLINYHKGEVEELLVNYKETLNLVNSQKEILLHHNPNSTFIKPFRQIIISLRNALSQTYEEIIYFSKSKNNLKLLSGNPNCQFVSNPAYNLLNKFNKRFAKSKSVDCLEDTNILLETKDSLEAIAALLKYLIDRLPDVNVESEEEFENDTEAIFHNFIILLTVLTEDTLQTIHENQKILETIFDQILHIDIVQQPNAMENYYKSSASNLKLLCGFKKSVQDITNYINTTSAANLINEIKKHEYGNVEKLSFLDSAILIGDIVYNAAHDLLNDCDLFENPKKFLEEDDL